MKWKSGRSSEKVTAEWRGAAGEKNRMYTSFEVSFSVTFLTVSSSRALKVSALVICLEDIEN